jgi:hypothetical protein
MTRSEEEEEEEAEKEVVGVAGGLGAMRRRIAGERVALKSLLRILCERAGFYKQMVLVIIVLW